MAEKGKTARNTSIVTLSAAHYSAPSLEGAKLRAVGATLHEKRFPTRLSSQYIARVMIPQ